LRQEISLEEGGVLAVGSVGTIERIYPRGVAYDVKFPDVTKIQTVSVDDIDHLD
jgi:hypothetical protein